MKPLKPASEKFTSARKEEFEEQVEWIIQLYPPDELRVKLQDIVMGENIILSTDNYNTNGVSDFEGLILSTHGKFFIFINKDNVKVTGKKRSVYSLAHELGHYFIEEHHAFLLKYGELVHHKLDGIIQRETLMEREADYFAACLLLPRSLFVPEIEGKVFNMFHLRKLSGQFGVSLIVVIKRYVLLGSTPIMVIQTRKGKLINGRYPLCSKNFPFHTLRTAREDEVPAGSLHARLIKTGSFHDFRQEMIPMQQWFANAEPGRFLMECCFYYNGNQMLTSILWEVESKAELTTSEIGQHTRPGL